MSEIVLNDSLIEEYLKFKFDESYDKNTIRKLLKLIHPFYLRDDGSLDPALPMQLNNDPLISIVDNCNDNEIVDASLFKLMLTDSVGIKPFTTININNPREKLSLKFSARYTGRLDKAKAQQHIKDLISSALWIKITDAYIVGDSNQWNENKRLLEDIIPFKVMDFTISGAEKDRSVINANEKNELNTICSDWNIIPRSIGSNIHDRYIETDKIIILLSSGLYHLSSTSSKDFTYVVEVK